MKYILQFLLLILTFSTSPGFAQQGKPVLNHIAVYVKDLAVSTAFYSEVVDLDTIPEPFHDGKHTWFSLSPTSHLHIISGAAEKTAHDKNAHLCFSVPSVEAVIGKLNQHHIAYESWAGKAGEITTRVDGIKQIYFKDPDGYWIEINNDYPKSN